MARRYVTELEPEYIYWLTGLLASFLLLDSLFIYYGEDGLRARGQGPDGVICVKTNMCVITATYNSDIRAENTNNVLTSLSEYLTSMNY